MVSAPFRRSNGDTEAEVYIWLQRASGHCFSLLQYELLKNAACKMQLGSLKAMDGRCEQMKNSPWHMSSGCIY